MYQQFDSNNLYFKIEEIKDQEFKHPLWLLLFIFLNIYGNKPKIMKLEYRSDKKI